jgi:hypothetical protein
VEGGCGETRNRQRGRAMQRVTGLVWEGRDLRSAGQHKTPTFSDGRSGLREHRIYAFNCFD